MSSMYFFTRHCCTQIVQSLPHLKKLSHPTRMHKHGLKSETRVDPSTLAHVSRVTLIVLAHISLYTLVSARVCDTGQRILLQSLLYWFYDPLYLQHRCLIRRRRWTLDLSPTVCPTLLQMRMSTPKAFATSQVQLVASQSK